MSRICRCANCITPPHILLKLLESKDKDIRQAALNTLLSTSRMRGARLERASLGGISSGNGRRTIFDCENCTDLQSAVVVHSEDGPPSTDDSPNRAFDGFGTTR